MSIRERDILVPMQAFYHSQEAQNPAIEVEICYNIEHMGISLGEKKSIVRTVRSVPGARDLAVVIFGSQARGDARFGSDIDIGVEHTDGQPIAPGIVADIQEALDESPLKQRTEVVDLSRTSREFRTEALSHAIAL